MDQTLLPAPLLVKLMGNSMNLFQRVSNLSRIFFANYYVDDFTLKIEFNSAMQISVWIEKISNKRCQNHALFIAQFSLLMLHVQRSLLSFLLLLL